MNPTRRIFMGLVATLISLGIASCNYTRQENPAIREETLAELHGNLADSYLPDTWQKTSVSSGLLRPDLFPPDGRYKDLILPDLESQNFPKGRLTTLIPPFQRFSLEEFKKNIPRKYTDEELKKHIRSIAEILDCLSVSPRSCSHVYPTVDDLELCNVTAIVNRKSDGQLISGPDIGWRPEGRYPGVAVGIKVVGDRFLNKEAFYIYHIEMNVYHKTLAPDLVHALRGYCTGLPNNLSGAKGSNNYTHCVCGAGPGGTRREYCHVYKDGRLVNTNPGTGNRCGF